jgi:hypothetical protein
MFKSPKDALKESMERGQGWKKWMTADKDWIV